MAKRRTPPLTSFVEEPKFTGPHDVWADGTPVCVGQVSVHKFDDQHYAQVIGPNEQGAVMGRYWSIQSNAWCAAGQIDVARRVPATDEQIAFAGMSQAALKLPV